ncbi:MAG: uridine kinase [Thermoanaerobaculum sp.]|nr:uridine kinase [Thermoanaerobaculum sp.]MCX7894604.1 uridine kinase [Thermoanaerobaculum sp.]MDW7967284.1 uridine kinase [Thermoanaerobaculum sp.]
MAQAQRDTPRNTAPKVVCIGVAGGTGSGKTTVAEAIVARIGAHRIAYIQHDSYYRDLSHLPPAERLRCNFDHPDALETDLLVAHLADLKSGRGVDIPVYDFTAHVRTTHTRRVEPRKVILVEGILIFAEKSLREQFDIRIFVDTDADLRLIRRLRRDIAERGRSVESVITQYLETVRPMHLEFVEPSKRWADVIIPEGGFNTVALDMVCARVEALLSGEGA